MVLIGYSIPVLIIFVARRLIKRNLFIVILQANGYQNAVFIIYVCLFDGIDFCACSISVFRSALVELVHCVVHSYSNQTLSYCYCVYFSPIIIQVFIQLLSNC